MKIQETLCVIFVTTWKLSNELGMRNKDSNSQQLAERWNCQIGEIDHTPPKPWE